MARPVESGPRHTRWSRVWCCRFMRSALVPCQLRAHVDVFEQVALAAGQDRWGADAGVEQPAEQVPLPFCDNGPESMPLFGSAHVPATARRACGRRAIDGHGAQRPEEAQERPAYTGALERLLEKAFS